MSQNIKVAFCLRDMQLGGVESVLVRLLESVLARGGVDVTFVSYVNITEPIYRDWLDAHPQIQRRVLYPSRWLGTQLPHFFVWRLAKHFVRDAYRWWRRVFVNRNVFKDFDAVIDFYDFGFYKEIKNLKCPKMAWWHSSITKFIKRDSINFMDGYNTLVALTDGFVEEFNSLYPKYAGRAVRIYNPVDVEHIRSKLKRKVRIKDYFCAVSRLSPDKDIETILRAFDKFWIAAGRPNVKMVVVGGGDAEQHFRQIAESLPSKKHIVFTGATPNPFEYMRGARAHILSSHSEGLGMVLIEAMAVGTPNISSDCKNGPREILLDGRAGLLFAPGDVAELALRMDDVWNQRVDIEKMTQRATKSLSRFSADAVAKDVLKLLNS